MTRKEEEVLEWERWVIRAIAVTDAEMDVIRYAVLGAGISRRRTKHSESYRHFAVPNSFQNFSYCQNDTFPF